MNGVLYSNYNRSTYNTEGGQKYVEENLKKLIATALAVATVATTMVAPVSASTLTPKKSHSDAEVQERVLYLIDKADDIAISPWYNAPSLESGVFSDRKTTNSYRALQMCYMLLATPNLDSACSPETVAELKQAKKTWKSACCANYMYMFYNQVWRDTAIVADENVYPSYRTYFGTKPGKNNYNKVWKKPPVPTKGLRSILQSIRNTILSLQHG